MSSTKTVMSRLHRHNSQWPGFAVVLASEKVFTLDAWAHGGVEREYFFLMRVYGSG